MPNVDDVLCRVSALSEQIEDGGRRSEELRTCPADLVEALREAGLFYLQVPAAVGGLELPFADQMRVYEELARLDPNVGWTVIVGNGTGGLVGTRLPDEAVPNVYSGSTPPLLAGALAPVALAVRNDDGYVVSGRASFGSGIHHAEWVMIGGFLADEAGAADTSLGPRMFVVPRDAVTIHDNWNVAGLQGTGSCDFSLDGVQIEPEFVADVFRGEAYRGGPVFRLPALLFIANGHLGFPLGVTRRALDEATTIAQGKLRPGNSTAIAHRGSFQQDLALHELGLRSARLLAYDTIGRMSEQVETGAKLPSGTTTEVMAVLTQVTRVAIDVCTWAFKTGGAHGLFRPHPLERCLRDMLAAGNHAYAKDDNLENWGRSLLGIS
jgi:alkylation response protein AidB-like acyl-CoA dehydrogenase